MRETGKLQPSLKPKKQSKRKEQAGRLRMKLWKNKKKSSCLSWTKKRKEG